MSEEKGSINEKMLLDTHLAVVHKGKRPFECHICDTKYTTKGYLNMYILLVPEEKQTLNATYSTNSFCFNKPRFM